jgi:hypothetical protein
LTAGCVVPSVLSLPKRPVMGAAQVMAPVAGHTAVDRLPPLHSDGARVPLLAFDVFEPSPTSRAQAVPRLFDATQEARVVLKSVLEPILFRFEADQHACGLAMAGDDDLLPLSFSKEARQIILDLG